MRLFHSIAIPLVLVILAAIALPSCQLSGLQPERPQVETAPEIPAHWVKTDLGRFSFFIPPSLKKRDVKGFDTSVWTFEDDDVSLNIEEGLYGADYNQMQSYYESKRESKTLNGEQMELLTANLNHPNLENWTTNADGSTRVGKVDKPYLVAAFFPQRNVSIGIYTKSEESQVANTIIHSVRFQ